MEQHIDILMATYNGERHLIEQINSILNQGYQKQRLHLIIKDDQSSDQTQSILETISKQNLHQIKYIPSQCNGGVIKNFSDLMPHSTSNYIMFSDQDDIWLPDKVTSTFKKMQELEKLHGPDTPLLIHTDLAVVNEKLLPISPSFWNYSKITPQHTATLNRLLVQNVITGCTIMINRKLLELASPIPQEALMHDWWLGLVAAAFGRIGALNEATMLYRQHNANCVGAQSINISLELKKMLANFSDYSKKIHSMHEKQRVQASSFLTTYRNQLSPAQIKSLEAFCGIKRHAFFQKTYRTIKHGFYKNGLLRNLKDLFL